MDWLKWILKHIQILRGNVSRASLGQALYALEGQCSCLGQWIELPAQTPFLFSPTQKLERRNAQARLHCFARCALVAFITWWFWEITRQFWISFSAMTSHFAWVYRCMDKWCVKCMCENYIYKSVWVSLLVEVYIRAYAYVRVEYIYMLLYVYVYVCIQDCAHVCMYIWTVLCNWTCCRVAENGISNNAVNSFPLC